MPMVIIKVFGVICGKFRVLSVLYEEIILNDYFEPFNVRRNDLSEFEEY